MSKTAIILGATGLTGGLLTELLIKDETFSKIKLISRRATGFEHPKVEDIICNVLALETIKSQFTGDVVFCCIGTTKAKTPDRVYITKSITASQQLLPVLQKRIIFLLLWLFPRLALLQRAHSFMYAPKAKWKKMF